MCLVMSKEEYRSSKEMPLHFLLFNLLLDEQKS